MTETTKESGLNLSILSNTWDTDTLDPGKIHDELTKLWAKVHGPKKAGLLADGESRDQVTVNGGMLRANTLNLIAVAPDRSTAELITGTVAQLRDFLPSRTIIFITDPNAQIPNTWRVEVKLNEGDNAHKETQILFETITITSDPKMGGHLASIVSPLLVSELPTFLWWPSGYFAGNPVFVDIVEVCDRLIVDSARLGNDASAVAQLRTLLDDDDDPYVGDITWDRMQPWRQLIAQFFDPVEAQESLHTITQVNIAYAVEREDHGSGFAATLLTIGWLATRLGWEFIEPLEPRKAGGWTVSLRARNPEGKARLVQLRLSPDQSKLSKFSLRSVELIATGEHEGTFRIVRTDHDDLITSSETAHIPYVSRMVYARRKPLVDLLGEELQRFGPDRVFEESIRFATKLLPN